MTEIVAERAPIVDIQLDIGTAGHPVALWARVTARAVQELALTPGREVFALVKTVALDRTSYGRFDLGPGEDDPM